MSLFMFVSIFSLNCLAVNSSKPTKILFIGDSIPAGYLLDENEIRYSDIIKNYYGDKVTVNNIAVSGYTTDDLISQIDNSEYNDLYKNSDIFVVSIGANDIMNAFYRLFYGMSEKYPDFITAANEIIKDKDSFNKLLNKINEGADNAVKNIPVIESKLIEANPDARIIFQTIYSPFEVLSGNTIYPLVLSVDFVTNTLLSKVNSAILRLENSDIANIRSIFKSNGWFLTNINEYDIHPNQYGHIVIASEVLSKLNLDNSNRRYKLYLKELTDKYLNDYYRYLYQGYASNGTETELLNSDKLMLELVGINIPEQTETVTTTSVSQIITTSEALKTQPTSIAITAKATTSETEATTTSKIEAKTIETTQTSVTRETIQANAPAESEKNVDNRIKISVLIIVVTAVALTVVFCTLKKFRDKK